MILKFGYFCFLFRFGFSLVVVSSELIESSSMELNEEEKHRIVHELNLKIGCDMTELRTVYDLENELIHKRDHLQSCVSFIIFLR